MKRVIGLSGFAGCGKDLFAALLQKKIPQIKRFALADQLKKEINSYLIEAFGINIFNCSREEKDLIRPLLVEHGKIKRILTRGTYWTSFLEPHINNYLAIHENNIACITDIRYDFFPEDEVYWITKKMNGILVHLKVFQEENGSKIFNLPPNSHEEENDPKIQKAASYRIEWPKAKLPNGTIDFSRLEPYVNQFIKFIET